MKFLILFSLFLFASTSTFAQAVAATDTRPATKTEHTKAVETVVSPKTVAAHNKSAHKQIVNHLNEFLDYPTEMEALALEGTVIAAIAISGKGELARITIAKSDLPEAFHRELLICLVAFEKLELKRGEYLGDGVLYVPVRFKL